jgi:pyridoxine 5-phosphate synthase
VRADDVAALAALVAAPAELNIEGNPFAPPREGYPGLLALVAAARPAQVTFVPDGDGQLTSDHGFDLQAEAARLAPLVAAYRAAGARVSLFVDAGVRGLERAAAIGVERIELYTGPFAEAHAAGDARAELAALAATAAEARALGLAVNAGHDLSQANLGEFLAGVPGVAEVSIGHALIGEALYAGLDATVKAYLAILARAR